VKLKPADVLGISGLLTFALGLWWVYPPASVIFAGTVQFVLGLILATRESKEGGKR
jgi:fatty acid desaturase